MKNSGVHDLFWNHSFTGVKHISTFPHLLLDYKLGVYLLWCLSIFCKVFTLSSSVVSDWKVLHVAFVALSEHSSPTPVKELKAHATELWSLASLIKDVQLVLCQRVAEQPLSWGCSTRAAAVLQWFPQPFWVPLHLPSLSGKRCLGMLWARALWGAG